MIPIVDDNLKLAIVDELIAEGVLPMFDRNKFVLDNDLPRGEALRGPDEEPPEDTDDDPDYHKVYEIESELLSWLKPEHLPRVTRISWGGGARVQHWIWNYWDGEGGEFDVVDLTGISACTSLRDIGGTCFATRDLQPLAGMETLEYVFLSSGGEDGVTDVRPLSTLPRLKKLDLRYHRHLKDLSPLAGHGALEELDLGSTAVTDLSFALELPRLKRLHASPFGAGTIADQNASVLATLRSRGVDVKVK